MKTSVTNTHAKRSSKKKRLSADAYNSFKRELKNINSKYTHAFTPAFPSAKWRQTALAGAAGVWAGALAGASDGSIIAGAAAAYGAACSIYTSSRTACLSIGAIDANDVYANPAGNVYDIPAGRRYNQLLTYLILNHPPGGPADARMLYRSVALSASEKAFHLSRQHEITDVYVYLKTNGALRFIKSVLARSIDDSDLLQVMNAYMCGVANTNSLAAALCITYDYEYYISNNKLLTALQRNILLQGMAVAKYGFYFWNRAL